MTDRAQPGERCSSWRSRGRCKAPWRNSWVLAICTVGVSDLNKRSKIIPNCAVESGANLKGMPVVVARANGRLRGNWPCGIAIKRSGGNICSCDWVGKDFDSHKIPDIVADDDELFRCLFIPKRIQIVHTEENILREGSDVVLGPRYGQIQCDRRSRINIIKRLMASDWLLKHELAAQVPLPEQPVRILGVHRILCRNNAACQQTGDKYKFAEQPADSWRMART